MNEVFFLDTYAIIELIKGNKIIMKNTKTQGK